MRLLIMMMLTSEMMIMLTPERDGNETEKRVCTGQRNRKVCAAVSQDRIETERFATIQ